MGEAGLLVRLKHKALTQGRVYQHQVRSKMSEVHTDVGRKYNFYLVIGKPFICGSGQLKASL